MKSLDDKGIMDALMHEGIECWSVFDESGDICLNVGCKDFEKVLKILEKLGINRNELEVDEED